MRAGRGTHCLSTQLVQRLVEHDRADVLAPVMHFAPELEGNGGIGRGAVGLTRERPVESEDRANIGKIRIVAREHHESRRAGNGWCGSKGASDRPLLEKQQHQMRQGSAAARGDFGRTAHEIRVKDMQRQNLLQALQRRRPAPADLLIRKAIGVLEQQVLR